MDNSTRNLMIAFSVIALLSLAGVALNIIPIFNLKSLEDSKLTEEVSRQLTKGFSIIAFLYLLIFMTTIGVVIKAKYSKKLLIILIITLISIFVFGQFIFDLLLDDNALDVNFK